MVRSGFLFWCFGGLILISEKFNPVAGSLLESSFDIRDITPHIRIVSQFHIISGYFKRNQVYKCNTTYFFRITSLISNPDSTMSHELPTRFCRQNTLLTILFYSYFSCVLCTHTLFKPNVKNKGKCTYKDSIVDFNRPPLR